MESGPVIPATNQIKRHFYYSFKIKAVQSDPISEECLCGGTCTASPHEGGRLCSSEALCVHEEFSTS